MNRGESHLHTGRACFAYDDADRRISLTTFREDAGDITTDPTERSDGDTSSWAYHDATGLEISKSYADGSVIRKEYNVLSLLSQKTDARSIVASYTWDHAKGVCLQIAYSDSTPTQEYTYNQLAHINKVTDASGTRSFEYNEYDEAISEALIGDAITHLVTETQDTYGRSTGYTYAKAGALQQSISVEYGADGRRSSAGFPHAGVQQRFSYAYLPGSHLLHSLTHPNNILITRSYEEQRDLITSMNATRASTDVVLRSYTYDPLGRPMTRSCSRQGTTRNDSFGYNDRSELSSASLGASPYAYDYDNIGNRKTAQEITEEISYDANNINQYSSITQGETPFVPIFDADGNQSLIQSSTGIWAVSYNAESRPISFTKIEGDQTTIIECGYDYMGRRYMKKVSVNGDITLHQRYLYRGYLQIACVDLTRGGQPALWLSMWDPTELVATRPLAIQKNATWYSYGHDLTKNVTELYHTNGTIATTYDYSPFGVVTATGTEQPYQWSSEVYDAELGLVYYNYRYYNPRDGRWINRDHIAEQGGINLYGFVGNNPKVFYDILGMLCEVEYSIKLHKILVRKKDKDENILRMTTTKVFSGNENGKNNPDNIKNENNGPIPPGKYYIIERQSGGMGGQLREWLHGLVTDNDKTKWLALIAIDDKIDDETKVDGVVRSNFRMHYGTTSLGCITFMDKIVFEEIREFILATESKTLEGTDYIYYGTLEVKSK